MLKKHHKSFQRYQKIVDIALVSFSWFISYLIRFELLSGGQTGLESEFLKIWPFLVTITLTSLHRNDLYKSLRFTSRYKEILNLIKGNFLAVIGLVILLYFGNDERVSRLTIIIYFLLSTTILTVARILMRNFLRLLRLKGKNLRHILLIGNSPLLSDYVNTARAYKDSGIRFLGWIDSNELAVKHNIKEINIEYSELRNENTPDAVILAYSGASSYKTHEFLSKNYNDIVPVQILPDLSYSMVGHQIEDFGGIPLLSVNQPSFNTFELILKRLVDFLGAGIGSLLISPLLLFIALGVKLTSPGPLLFGQTRIGLNGEEFKMWKFRSMRVAVDGEDTKEWSNKENPRKTRFGDFLRRTSLDELPQLLNVLIGHMSLVGPRPEQPYFVEKFRHEIPGYMLKHKMKPGMTGWAQVNGWRGDTDLNKRIECDIFYIKNWSFIMDIKILFLTLFKGFINKNAY